MHRDPLNANYEACMRSHHCWPWFLGLGIVLIVVGMMAIGSAFIATLASVLVFGWLLFAGGIVEIVNAFLTRSWQGFFVFLLGGLMHVIVGILMIEHPQRAAEALTMMIAILLLIAGVVRIVHALADRLPGWGWVLLNGVITLLLGISIWRQWPESGLWVIGLFVGIDLVFNGWSWVMLALILKGIKQQAQAGNPSAAT